jgi:hypothetical protein
MVAHNCSSTSEELVEEIVGLELAIIFENGGGVEKIQSRMFHIEDAIFGLMTNISFL